MSGLSIPGISLTPPAPSAGQTVRPLRAAKPADKHGWWWGTGRRKAAVARIRMKPADGEKATIIVETANGVVKPASEFFVDDRDRMEVTAALRATSLLGKMHIVAKVHGGGFMGQAGAIKLAIARALRDFDPNLEGTLRTGDMLTRDSRKVERKKYGQAGARRRFQFSKR